MDKGSPEGKGIKLLDMMFPHFFTFLDLVQSSRRRLLAVYKFYLGAISSLVHINVRESCLVAIEPPSNQIHIL